MWCGPAGSFTARQQPSEPTRIFARDPSSVERSTYDPTKPTKILIHGWLAHHAPGTGGDVLKDGKYNRSHAHLTGTDNKVTGSLFLVQLFWPPRTAT